MDFITILFIGIGLAMDASAVSLAKGMGLDKDQVKKYAFILALAFGLFQALMPAIGYFAGSQQGNQRRNQSCRCGRSGCPARYETDRRFVRCHAF